MMKLTKTTFAKYQLITVGVVLLIIKLCKAASYNWFIALSPFILLVAIRLLFFVWGYILYRLNNRKNG